MILKASSTVCHKQPSVLAWASYSDICFTWGNFYKECLSAKQRQRWVCGEETIQDLILWFNIFQVWTSEMFKFGLKFQRNIWRKYLNDMVLSMDRIIINVI